MLPLRLIVTLGVCWTVKCDLLDLYVQHMDETMRTTFYRDKRHPMDPAARVKRSLVDTEPVLVVGNFKKQRLNFDEDWLTYWKANKKMYYKNDALDIPNKQEENLDPDQHEILSSNLEKTTTTSEDATDALVPIVFAKPTPSVAMNKVESIISQDPVVIEEEESEDESPVVQEQPAELEELAIGGSDSEEGLLMEDSTNFKVEEVENEENSQVEVIGENDRINPKSPFGDPSFKRPPKSWGRVPKKYSPFVDKLVKDTRETESRVKDETVRTKRSPQKQLRKPRFIRHEVLDDNGDVILEWDPLDEEEVTFRVTARTLGYVGIGFNEKTYMKGADILLAWVDDHTGAVNLLVSLCLSFSHYDHFDSVDGSVGRRQACAIRSINLEKTQVDPRPYKKVSEQHSSADSSAKSEAYIYITKALIPRGDFPCNLMF